MTAPEVIGPRNERKHLRRIQERRIEKERLRRDDRRKNFEAGESVGLLLAIGSVAVISGWRGGIAQVELEVWQRISIALMGVVLMTAQHVMRRNFHKRTDAPLIGAQKGTHHVDDSRS